QNSVDIFMHFCKNCTVDASYVYTLTLFSFLYMPEINDHGVPNVLPPNVQESGRMALRNIQDLQGNFRVGFQVALSRHKELQRQLQVLQTISNVRRKALQDVAALLKDEVKMPDDRIQEKLRELEDEYETSMRVGFKEWREFYRSLRELLHEEASAHAVITPHNLSVKVLERLNDYMEPLFRDNAKPVMDAIHDHIIAFISATNDQDRQQALQAIQEKMHSVPRAENPYWAPQQVLAILQPLSFISSGFEFTDEWSPEAVDGMIGNVLEEQEMDEMYEKNNVDIFADMHRLPPSSTQLVIGGNVESFYLSNNAEQRQHDVIQPLKKRLEDNPGQHIVMVHYRTDADFLKMLGSMSAGHFVYLVHRNDPQKRVVIEGVNGSNDFIIREGSNYISKDELLLEPMKYVDHIFELTLSEPLQNEQGDDQLAQDNSPPEPSPVQEPHNGADAA
ncbi:MAG: hypothetical protein JWM56_929, partial [Candidatus Peribacteria bacterium]|nr:hypothetical protein [Candidatus Peribacteria bacterium]